MRDTKNKERKISSKKKTKAEKEKKNQLTTPQAQWLKHIEGIRDRPKMI